MRSILLAARLAIAALVLPLGALAAQAVTSVPKIGFINSQAVLQAAPGRAEAVQQLERELGQYRQQVQRMGDSLNVLVADYNRQEVTLSPAARETRQKAIQEREAAYRERTQRLEEQAQQRQVAIMQPIMERIQKIIEDIRMEDGYSMIFDAASANGVIVAADKNLDLTERVISRLRATAAAPATPGTVRPGAAVPAPSGVQRPRGP